WAAWRLWKRDDGTPAADRAAAIASVAAFAGLVQFPWSVPMYFFYAAPFMIPLVLSACTAGGGSLRDRPGILVVLGFLLAFMLIVPMRIGTPARPGGAAPLATPRGGLSVHPHDAAGYARVVELLS